MKSQPERYSCFKITMGFLLPALCCSCFSYHTAYRHTMKSDFEAIEKPVVYVVNPDEYPATARVFQKAGIYRFTDDSSAAVKIQLKPIGISLGPHCITGRVSFMAITLGQWPVKEPQTNYLEYSKETADGELSISRAINFSKRIWFWDMFSFRKSRENAVARQLRYDFMVEADSEGGER